MFSLLAPWIGGAGAAPAEQGSVRSLLAPWVGGASAPVNAQGGFRGLFAFWAGGASAAASAPPVEPELPPERPVIIGGGSGWWEGPKTRRKTAEEYFEEAIKGIEKELEPIYAASAQPIKPRKQKLRVNRPRAEQPVIQPDYEDDLILLLIN